MRYDERFLIKSFVYLKIFFNLKSVSSKRLDQSLSCVLAKAVLAIERFESRANGFR